MRSIAIIIFFNGIFILNIWAQDSLHLVMTIEGDSPKNPILHVAKLGDINGDGNSDFIVSYPERNYCDIYLGSNNFSSKPSVRINAPDGIYDFGFVLRGIGDVNGDNYDDFMIKGKYDELYFKGKVFLYLGGSEVDTIPVVSYIDSNYFVRDAFGTSISGGDINGDGFSDFAISSPANWDDGLGRVYLYLGSENVQELKYYTFVSDSLDDIFGDNVILDGDFNGDGYNDLILNNSNPLGYYFRKPNLFIVKGNSDFSPNLDTLLTRNTSYVSIEPSYLSDVNGDGTNDLLVLMRGDSTYPVVYFGTVDFDTTNFMEFNSYPQKDNFGIGLENIGDINNDGFGDFAINVKNYVSNDKMVGKLNIYMGKTIVDTIPDYFLEGETHWGEFGKELGELGDINGDGFVEFYVLAPKYPDFENPTGKVYIYSMKKFLVSTKDTDEKAIIKFKLYQNYPNPFNPSTNIDYELPRKEYVILKVFNLLGKEITTLVNKYQLKGMYSVTFDATELPSGVYYYKLNIGNFSKIFKMLLLK